jgi:hypothetical protein
MEFLKKKAQVLNKKTNIFTPSQNRILSMDKELLIKHYALVRHQVSKLSSEERRILSNRIQYGVEKGNITIEELQKEVDIVSGILSNEKV